MKMFYLDVYKKETVKQLQVFANLSTAYTKAQIYLFNLVKLKHIAIPYIIMIMDDDEFEMFTKTVEQKVYLHNQYSFDMGTSKDIERVLSLDEHLKKVQNAMRNALDFAQDDEFFEIARIYSDFIENYKTRKRFKEDEKTYFQYLEKLVM